MIKNIAWKASYQGSSRNEEDIQVEWQQSYLYFMALKTMIMTLYLPFDI